MRNFWNVFSTLAATAVFAGILVTVPQTPLNAQGKGGAKAKATPFSAGGAGAVSAYNLKVLTAQNVEFTMQNITLALGEGCVYCHELNDLSLDTKPKKAKALMMLEMVRDINAKFGDGQTHVTCWTCHRASTKPQLAKVASN